MSMELRIKKSKRNAIFGKQHRQDEARQRISHALQRWQDACDAWLVAKSGVHARKDYDAIRRERVLKNHIDQAADDLKHALLMANVV